MDLLNWLQDWYNQQCDGLWEHAKRIRIGTLDNPGWMVDINLEETEWELKEFKTINDDRTENDWIMCKIENCIFKGRGGPLNLEEILKIFHDWILN